MTESDSPQMTIQKACLFVACTRSHRNVPVPFCPLRILHGWPGIEFGLTLHITIRFAR